MDDLTMPDFVEWANKLLDREDVAIALEQAYNQGRYLTKIQLQYLFTSTTNSEV
jgi:hypothetical protein